ncbi:MAG: RNA polymerase sigma factor [Gammaproteobacteria bacterium]
MTPVDRAFVLTQSASHEGFADWVRLCELPIRRGLRAYAAAVDVEAVLQEALLRMWRLAPTLELEGDDASLKFALRMAKNLALSEARRVPFQSLDEHPELGISGSDPDPQPPVDPALRRIIQKCMQALPRRPYEALMKRFDCKPDNALATELGLRKNTFLQHIVRARKLLAGCLERNGVDLEEHLT